MSSVDRKNHDELHAELKARRAGLAARRGVDFRAVFENTLDEIYIISSRTTRFLHANRSARENLGYTMDELREMSPLDLNPDRDPGALKEMMLPLLDGRKEMVVLETRHIRKNGTAYPAELHIHMQRGGDGPILVGMVLDKTDQQRAQQENRQLEEQLRQVQRLETVGTLAGGIAHDFNNILSPIIGYAELLRDQIPPDSLASSDLKHIENAAWRAKDLVEQLLTFSCRSEEERRPVKISLIIKEGLKLLRATLPASVLIRQEIASDTGNVLADPVQIHQVLVNLCTNASHAMKEEGGRLTITLGNGDCAFDPESGLRPAVVLSVEDTGHGMDTQSMMRVFEPFYTTKRADEGSGLGMSVVHGIVRGHGGRIEVDSEPGVGSRFRIYLPLFESDAPAGDEVRRTASRGGERILFVDDEEEIAALAMRILESFDYEVTAFTNSEAALALFEMDPDAFDLLITNYTMPGLSGLKLAERVRRMRPRMPAMLITGISEPELSQILGSGAFKACLKKPLALRELGMRVREVLDSHQTIEV